MKEPLHVKAFFDITCLPSPILSAPLAAPKNVLLYYFHLVTFSSLAPILRASHCRGCTGRRKPHAGLPGYSTPNRPATHIDILKLPGARSAQAVFKLLLAETSDRWRICSPTSGSARYEPRNLEFAVLTMKPFSCTRLLTIDLQSTGAHQGTSFPTSNVHFESEHPFRWQSIVLFDTPPMPSK